jgi:hypothetical protein
VCLICCLNRTGLAATLLSHHDPLERVYATFIYSILSPTPPQAIKNPPSMTMTVPVANAELIR